MPRTWTAPAHEQRSIVWTWAMRGTLHLIAAQDVAWMVGLLGPVFAAGGRRRRLALDWMTGCASGHSLRSAWS